MDTTWQLGDRIDDRWEIQQILGGGMGVIYVVQDNETGEQLAAKTYRDDVLAVNPKLAFRFEREALAWVNLDSHPNVVKAKYVRTVQNKPLLFLEYVAGGNLRNILTSLQVSTIDKETDEYYQRLSKIQDLALSFCDGMIHAAKCGITAHRDIKAENCLIAENTQWWGSILKITDFGLAKVFDEAAINCDAPYIVHVPHDELIPNDLQSNETVYYTPVPAGISVFATRTGVAAGTPSHMAPEQFDDMKRVNVTADIYAFGVMLFQMIMGRLPFTGRTWQDYKRLHHTVMPPNLYTSYPSLNHIVARCLAKTPSQRFGDFLELRKALEPSVYDRYETYLRDLPPPSVASELTDDELLLKAQSLVVLRHHERALQVYDQVIRQNPLVRRAWLERGLLLMNIFRRFDEALASLEEAQRLGEEVLEEYIVLCRRNVI